MQRKFENLIERMVLFCIKWRITLNEIFHNKQTYIHTYIANVVVEQFKCISYY
jgi:hypothetical protein